MPAAEDGFLGFLGKIANVFQSTPNDAHVRVWQELRPWFGRLVQNAAPKWLPRIALGLPCSLPVYQQGRPVGLCAHSAISACDVCHRPCCLDHARIDQFGDAICFECVVEAIRSKKGQPRPVGSAPPPPPPADAAAQAAALAKARAAARRVLRIKKGSTFDEMRSAYKRQCHKWHPDHNPGNPEAVQKFHEIQHAWSLLKEEFPHQAA